jgi:hypothetical protein
MQQRHQNILKKTASNGNSSIASYFEEHSDEKHVVLFFPVIAHIHKNFKIVKLPVQFLEMAASY